MNRLGLAVVAALALMAAACSSGGSSVQPPPPPSGNFTLASLNGTYAFTTSGEVCAGCTVLATPMERVGSFTADGKGNITAGIYDVVTEGGGSSTVPINTGSNYTVSPDGRGTLTFMVTSSGGPTSVSFAFVLTSGSSGTSPATDALMMDETATGLQSSTGSGNFVLQNSAQFSLASVSGTYVFDFAGFDGNTTSGPFPESLVGEFLTSGNGAITSGLIDDNDGTALTSGSNMIPGTLTADPTNLPTSGRGTAVVEGQDYVFYIVNSGRVRFISSNATAGPMLSGDAVLQTSPPPASFTGSQVFIVAGSDSAGNGITRVGRFTASGTTLSKMLMDVDDASSQTQFNGLNNGSAAYDPATGRGTFTFQDSTGRSFTFVFYLSSASGGVLQDISPSNTAGVARVVADGSINAQAAGPFSGTNITGAYALNWSGLVTAGGSFGNTDEEDMLGQVKISSLSLSGTSDLFQFTSPTLTPSTGRRTSGQIDFNGGDGTGDDTHRVDMNVTLSGQSAVDVVVYIVNPQLAFFANRDNNGTPRLIAGILRAQAP